ncbi:MAG: cysteine desulfurase [Actinobacteria bacterium]|nr:cysteine desulfurase [Actinomycetota bacterium]
MGMTTGSGFDFDPAVIKKDFPILARQVRNGRDLVYLDSAATSQKPVTVLDAERSFYENTNAAVHRGVHQLAEEATDAYESARAKIAHLVGAKPQDLVFTKNATEAINLVAYAFTNATLLASQGQTLAPETRRFVLRPGDEILVTEMEHHANLVPWQQVCAKTGAKLRWLPVTDEGLLDLSQLNELVNPRTRVVALVHASNVLGTINPVRQIAERAHQVDAMVLVDACQSVPHIPVDVEDLGADFVTWSAHKMLGPTGLGFLWAKGELLAGMPPFISGGSMIEKVTMRESTFAAPPKRFEAGTPMAAQAVGTAAAVDYLSALGLSDVAAHDETLTAYALEKLRSVPGLDIVGPKSPSGRIGAISFVIEGIHPHDVGQVLDDEGIAVRTGHHCAWPLMQRFGVPATTRASFYVYNQLSDVDALVDGLQRVKKIFD